MSTMVVFLLAGMMVAVGCGAYMLGISLGIHRQQRCWSSHMELGNRYRGAVADLDNWCGHTSPHARLISRHLKAIGDGQSLNSGTPVADEACTIYGLREQLSRLDDAILKETKQTEISRK